MDSNNINSAISTSKGYEVAIEYEKAVLSAMLQNERYVQTGLASLSTEEFYDVKHRDIFEAIRIMWKKNRKIDYITILEYIGNTPQNKQYLPTLIDTVPQVSENGFNEYCRLLSNAYKARNALSILHMADLSGLNGGDVTENIRITIERLSELIQDKSASKFRPVYMEMIDIFSDLSHGVFQKGRIDTGIKKLDEILDGIYPSDLITIAAGTGVGKTAIMLDIAKNIALNGKKVLLYTLEMSAKQNAQRLMANHSGVNLKSIKNGVDLTHEQLQKLYNASFEFSQMKLNLHINDTGGIKVSDIRLDLMAIPDADVIIIDHIGLVAGESSARHSRYEEITQIVIDLKALAAKLNKSIIILCQLNRASAPLRGGMLSEPQLHNLRDSGEVEQSSSSVIMLWKLPDYDYSGKIGVKVAKNRQGGIGKFAVKFKPNTMRYEPVEHDFNEYDVKKSEVRNVI